MCSSDDFEHSRAAASENSWAQIWAHSSGDGAFLAASDGDEAQNSIVTVRLTRDRIIDLLRELPADATIDDAIEKLAFVARIQRAIATLDAGRDVPHDEALRRIASADVRFDRGVPVFPPRRGAPVLTIEDVDRLARASGE